MGVKKDERRKEDGKIYFKLLLIVINTSYKGGVILNELAFYEDIGFWIQVGIKIDSLITMSKVVQDV